MANEGYTFDHWSGDLSGSENPIIITLIMDSEVTAHFTGTATSYTLTVDVSPGGSGVVSLEPSQPAGGYVAGTGVTLTAVASEGYQFDHWGGDLSGSTNPASITMTSNKGVTAYFVGTSTTDYTLTVNVSPGGSGAVSLDPTQPAGGYVSGTGVTLTAVASEGYRFDHWGGDLSGSMNPTTITMTSNKGVTAYFVGTTTTYTLRVNVSPGGSGLVSLEPSQPAGRYVAGTRVTLTAVAGEGYRFDHWSGDLSGSMNPRTITMTSNKGVTAYFAPTAATYTLTVDVSPGGSGVVSLDPTQPGGGYVAGTKVTLTAVAGAGYRFDHWGGDISGSTNPTSVTMTSNKGVTAYFTRISYALIVDVCPGGSGVVSLDPTQPAGGYVSGTGVTLTAVASEGYRFDHWDGNISGSMNPTTITMTSNKGVTAYFVGTTTTYALTVNVSPGGSGMVSLDPTQPAGGYVVGTEVTLSAVAGEGYGFEHWSGDLSGSENPATIIMDSDKEVTADFAQITYTLMVNGNGVGGTVTLEPSEPAGWYVVGTEVNLTAVASEGYRFDHWSGDISGSENPTTIELNSDKEVTAHFVQVYTLTVDVNPGGGTVTLEPSEPAGEYVTGTEVILTAVAGEGYRFDHWSGDLSGLENPTTMTMDSDREVTAHFAQVHTLTVDVNPGGGTVTLEPSEPAGWYVVGTEVSLTAVASEEYRFDHWSGDISGSENPTAIELNSDKEVTAHFVQVHTLTVDVNPGGGTVTLEPSEPAGWYVVGMEVSLTAVAIEGYRFDHWSGDLAGLQNPITTTLDSDMKVTAIFTEVVSSPFPWWWIAVGIVVVGLVVYLQIVYFLVMRRLQG